MLRWEWLSHSWHHTWGLRWLEDVLAKKSETKGWLFFLASKSSRLYHSGVGSGCQSPHCCSIVPLCLLRQSPVWGALGSIKRSHIGPHHPRPRHPCTIFEGPCRSRPVESCSLPPQCPRPLWAPDEGYGIVGHRPQWYLLYFTLFCICFVWQGATVECDTDYIEQEKHNRP